MTVVARATESQARAYCSFLEGRIWPMYGSSRTLGAAKYYAVREDLSRYAQPMTAAWVMRQFATRRWLARNSLRFYPCRCTWPPGMRPVLGDVDPQLWTVV